MCLPANRKRGKIVQPPCSNQLTIKPVKVGDYYIYLSVDENIEFVGAIKKDKILKEYTNRVRKNLELRIIRF